jgi:hypothetical protein
MTKISAKCFNSMIQESDDEPLEEQWEDQRQAEWEKECANRAALIESLIDISEIESNSEKSHMIKI